MSGERGTRYSHSFEIVNCNETQPFQYTGQRKEVSIGLYDYNARFYDPMLGRFTQSDMLIPSPADPQSWDRYAYVKNNPLRYTDPSGRYEFEEKPNDPFYVPSHPGINPSRRYITIGVTKDEADKIFARQIKNPIMSSDPMPHYFGNDRGKRTFEDQWFGKKQYHASMDAEDEAGINIYPIAPGIVFFIGWTDMGNTVIVEHDIYGYKLYSVYGHLGQNRSNDPNVYVDNGIRIQVGVKVDYSSVIGITGNSKPGCDNCANHLHFEVRYATNINVANPSDPLMGMRYWAFEGENWRDYFFDLGKSWGYDEDNFGGW